MSTKKVHHAHIRAMLPELHHSLLEIVSAINRPERDDAILERAGLSLERALFPLIVVIERLGPIGVVDLASRVGRDYTTVSRQVARLEELGLVSRNASERDRRVSEAVITSDGKTVTKAVDRAREQMAQALFKNWSRTDFDELARLLRMFATDLDRSHR
jgi:DNA-binding MarR family transcriptional regulator